MLNLKNFIEEALKDGGVQNDSQDVWVVVDGEQYTVSVESVLGREEGRPFEASDVLETNEEHEAWEELYSQYVQW